jgi:hypothetical protein
MNKPPLPRSALRSGRFGEAGTSPARRASVRARNALFVRFRSIDANDVNHFAVYAEPKPMFRVFTKRSMQCMESAGCERDQRCGGGRLSRPNVVSVVS